MQYLGDTISADGWTDTRGYLLNTDEGREGVSNKGGVGEWL